MSSSPSGIPGFTATRIAAGPVTLNVHRGGAGAPLILLHGYPQNHHTWAKVAPDFARQFDVIVPDLRGYGSSDVPPDDSAHSVYAKRTMAADLAALLSALNLPAAHVIGHDRGARVAYRFALDHPERILSLGIIEIVPTGDFWANWSAEVGLDAYHWTFLAQPAPLPERMIGADPAAYLDWTLASWSGTADLSPFSPEALASYRAQMAAPERCAAMCADYRAGATTDRQIDEADRAAGRRIACPVHFLYADQGFPASTGNPAALWRPWAPDLATSTCRTGHFVMEEDPPAVLSAFLPFLGARP